MNRSPSDASRRSSTTTAPDHPEFLTRLGVAPPVTVEDVKQAYLTRVKTAHPDVGGNPADFMALQEAFERATEYASFFESRRRWLSNAVERYVAQEEIITEVRRLGGSVATESIDWLRSEIGDDFSQLLDRIVEIRLAGSGVGDPQVMYLVERHRDLETVASLDLSAARIGDATASRLCELTNLKRLNLTGTGVTNAVFDLADSLSSLQWLGVSGTRVTWFGAHRARRRFPELTIQR
ncbi:MAG: J domain-containing protein [Pirellulales bacterium]